MKQIKVSFLLAILMAAAFIVKAQDEAPEQKKSYFKAGVKYLSDNVYLGRKDSTTVSYITPTIGYYNKSGFFITAGASYLPNNGANRIDLVTAEAGYDFDIKEKFYGGVYAGKYFYSSKSYAVNAEVGTGIGTYGSLSLGSFSLNAGAGLNLGSQTDVLMEAGVSNSFTDNSGKIEFIPEIKFNAGTQQYFNRYFTTGRVHNPRKGKGRGRGTNGGGGTTTTKTESVLRASHFKMLDYELTAPFIYESGKFEFKFTPTYAIPVNAATIETANGIVKEGLSNHFYAELELYYKF
ncbi:MAG: hypothetical protein EKK37_01565 [Sphingobacteriales bacterium]|nr:MAG: hypothetical protein EKK37_01565 [Sphingobacteriales bacterium]